MRIIHATARMPELPGGVAPPPPEPTAFQLEPTLGALHGRGWLGVLITDGPRAFAHAIAPSRIADTGWFDVEPFVGYGGPRVNTDDAEFIREALAVYGRFCRERRIVAELVRFDPLRPGVWAGAGLSAALRVVSDKPVVYVPVERDESAQLAHYSDPCRRRVKSALAAGLRGATVAPAGEDWPAFVALYRASMRRVGAAAQWLFDDAFFARLRGAAGARLHVVRSARGELASGAITLHDPDTAYYFLAANGDLDTHKGANNLLIHHLTRDAASLPTPARFVSLGGGNSPAEDDPLLVFKRKFARETRAFPLGFLTHDADALSELCRRAAAHDPANAAARMFLRYRLAAPLAPGRFSPSIMA